MKPYKMKDVCDKVLMPYETLRFYCNEGLVPNMERDENMHRRFDDKDVAWLEGVQALRACGFSIEELKAYMHLCFDGLSTVEARQGMLAEKRKKLLMDIKRIEESMLYIDQKNAYYDRLLSGEEVYESNLIKERVEA